MNDIFEAARNKIGPSLIHSFFNSEGSYSRAGEYYILSPLRADKSVGSFHINESSGQWFDHGSGEGGDFIELVSRARGVKLNEAADQIIRESGGVFIESSDYEKKSKSVKKKYSKPVIIPDTSESKKSLKKRVNSEWCLKNWGKPKVISRYFNKYGDWVFCVCRFESEKKSTDKKRSKNDILFYLGDDGKWNSKWHEDLKPFPPFGVHNLKDNNLPVLIVEGEKCGRISVPGYNVISWIGGTANVSKTDWSELRRREVYIWPDADSAMDKNNEYFLSREQQPGMKAAFYIKSQLPKAKILEIYRHKPIEDLPGGWDLADHVEEGGDPEQFIEDYTPHKSISVEIDPYQVYRKFIEDFYDFDSLEQVSGGFWIYDRESHFWRRTLKSDIISNFQRWLEDTGLQWIISKKQKATTFINDTKQYIDRHSTGYISNNPFKESAVSPYVHMRNGAIQISKESIDWIPRGKYEESHFKSMYPINCMDFEFDHDKYKDNEIDPKKDCPAFYFFVKEMIPRKYMESLSPAEREKAINDSINFFAQIIAYCISPIKPNEYFFGIYGNQRTGKTFLLKIIKSIIGKEFCVERQISDMDNRFASSVLWGKKVFIEPDLKTRQPLPEDFIKAYAGEQEITVEEKNLPAVDGVRTSIAMFFVSNYEFHTRGLEGLSRRMVMIPYKNDIKKHDARLLDKILGEIKHGPESGELDGEKFDERPAILSMAMKAWERFCDNDYLIESPEWAQREKDIWLIESNSVAKFLEETYFNNVGKTTVSRNEIHDSYKSWCTDEGRKPLGKKNFYEEVRRDSRIIELRLGGIHSFSIESSEENGNYTDDIPF